MKLLEFLRGLLDLLEEHGMMLIVFIVIFMAIFSEKTSVPLGCSFRYVNGNQTSGEAGSP